MQRLCGDVFLKACVRAYDVNMFVSFCEARRTKSIPSPQLKGSSFFCAFSFCELFEETMNLRLGGAWLISLI